MIRTECVIFLSMAAGGAIAALLATFFLALGKASRVARAVFDFLTPIAVGGIFILSLYLSSDGAFRLYAFAAFIVGGGIFRALYLRSRPLFRKVINALVVPIQSLERRIDARLEPIRQRRATKRRERREKRLAARAVAAERRAQKRAKREQIKAEKERKKRIARERKRARGEAREEGRYASDRPAIRQSH